MLPSVALRTLPKVIDAACYNRVRLALHRLGNPLRIALPRHRGLEAVLNDQAWLCVDSFNQDQPIIAWSQFETVGRQALHAPVACCLHFYHAHAGLIMGTALEALEETLAEKLAGLTGKSTCASPGSD